MSRSSRQTAWLVVGLALTIGPLPVAANDTVVGSIGGKWQPLNSEHIRMVSENIKARLGRERAHVTCEFLFKNEGPAQKVKVGFPQELGTAPLHDFRCWVDGEPVQVQSQVARASEERLDREFIVAHPYEGWHWWWMSFEPEQVRRVNHTYEAEYTQAAASTIIYGFSYVLRTGANWRGKIGDARVEIDLGAAANASIREATPSGYSFDAGRVAWHWEDFEPQEDIRLAWTLDPKVVLEGPTDPGTRRRRRIILPAGECLRGGVTCAPVRWIADDAGAECRWDADAETVSLVPRSGRRLQLTLGSRTAQTDWGALDLGAAVYRYSGRVMAPIRPVAEWLGLSVQSTAPGNRHLRLDPAS